MVDLSLPELREPSLRATYRGYYARGVGRLCCVFFGGWIGTSWECAEEAHRRLGPMAPQQHLLVAIDDGTYEVWS